MARKKDGKEREKLVKLLNLAASANVNEADAAFAKVEGYLSIKGFGLARGMLKDKNNCIPLTSRPDHWLQIVISCIEEAFSTMIIHEIVGCDWIVIGPEEDIDKSFHALQHLYDFASRGLEQETKKHKQTSHRAKTSFLEGFATGVDGFMTSSRQIPSWQKRLPKLSQELTDAYERQKAQQEQARIDAINSGAKPPEGESKIVLEQTPELHSLGIKHGTRAAIDVLGRTPL